MTATAETRLAAAGVWEEALSLLGDCPDLQVTFRSHTLD